jgi:glycosyltransferase involved in cell wall biosynthesis
MILMRDASFISARVRLRDPGIAPAEPTLSVVVPLYNEELNLAELVRRVRHTLDVVEPQYELILVNDGSHDTTPDRLDELAISDPRIVAVQLSRNFGHQAAVTAGLDHARGNAVVVLDGDLQDPPELIPELLSAWRGGSDVVYAVRRTRKESLPKRLAYSAFYRLFRSASDIAMPLDAGDFGLMDRRAVDALKRMPEKTRFVRGLRAFIGFRQTGIEYDRPARAAGETKYTFRKLMGLAADGLFNFSTLPIRLIGGMACLLFVATLIASMLAWVNTSILLAFAAGIGFVGSSILLALAIVGEYVRRIFIEVKGRPSYIVRDVTRSDRTVRPFSRVA